MPDQKVLDTVALDAALNVHTAIHQAAASRVAALYAAGGVAGLRAQIPDAEYVWIDVFDATLHRQSVAVCRVLDADGNVLWEADPVTDEDLVWDREEYEVEEIDSCVPDGFAAACEPAPAWYTPSWDDVPAAAGEMPATLSGDDPSLVVCSAIDARAWAAAQVFQSPLSDAGISFGDGAHKTMLDMLQRAADGGWTVEPLKAGQEPGHDATTLIRLRRVDSDGMHGEILDGTGDPTGQHATFGWMDYSRVHIY